MNVIRDFAVVASCASFFACGPASADVGNRLAGASDFNGTLSSTPQSSRAPSLVPATNPAPSVNPRDVKPRQAAKPYAARPACCSIHAAGAGSRGSVGTARGIPPNCITIDGNTGRCITNGQMPPPPRGVPVGTTSDRGQESQMTGQDVKPRRAARPYAAKPVCYGMHPVSAGSGGRVGTASGIPPNCITIDGNTGRCITNEQMPPPPRGVPVGTTSDRGQESQMTGQDVRPRRAVRPYAAKPVCYGMHPASAGSGDGVGTARGIPPNCITIDGNTGRCIINGRMPPPPPGVPVGTSSDPGP